MNILKLEKKEENEEDIIKDTIIESKLEDFEKDILFNVFEFDDKTIDKAISSKSLTIILPFSIL